MRPWLRLNWLLGVLRTRTDSNICWNQVRWRTTADTFGLGREELKAVSLTPRGRDRPYFLRAGTVHAHDCKEAPGCNEMDASNLQARS